MKQFKHEEINKEIKRLDVLMKEQDKLQSKVNAIIWERFNENDVINAANLCRQFDIVKIKANLQKNNLKKVFFDLSFPLVIAEFNKYKGKRIGKATLDKIESSLRETFPELRLWIDEIRNIYVDCDVHLQKEIVAMHYVIYPKGSQGLFDGSTWLGVEKNETDRFFIAEKPQEYIVDFEKYIEEYNELQDSISKKLDELKELLKKEERFSSSGLMTHEFSIKETYER